MDKKFDELIEACRSGHMYDFVSSNAHRFSKNELKEILRQTLFSIYEKLGDQSIEVEQLIPENLNEYNFFDTEGVSEDDEVGLYCKYLAGSLSFSEYYNMCKNHDYRIRLAK